MLLGAAKAYAAALVQGVFLRLGPQMPLATAKDTAAELKPGAVLYMDPRTPLDNVKEIAASLGAGAIFYLDPRTPLDNAKEIAASLGAGAIFHLDRKTTEETAQAIIPRLKVGVNIFYQPKRRPITILPTVALQQTPEARPTMELDPQLSPPGRDEFFKCGPKRKAESQQVDNSEEHVSKSYRRPSGGGT
jgi:hypothetical protein